MWHHQMTVIQQTYDGEFVESLKELRCEVDVLWRDVGVDEVDKLSSLSNYVERLEVVWLLSQVVLPDTHVTSLKSQDQGQGQGHSITYTDDQLGMTSRKT